ncbi:MAG: antitoxin [Actinobacteria bacterium]|nr:antitoxin [Actinomycetota bacterium]
MRTTVVLEPDVATLVEKLMRERGIGFTEAVNVAIRAGLGGRSPPARTPTFDLGEPQVPLEKALRLAGELEDDELARSSVWRE